MGSQESEVRNEESLVCLLPSAFLLGGGHLACPFNQRSNSVILIALLPLPALWAKRSPDVVQSFFVVRITCTSWVMEPIEIESRMATARMIAVEVSDWAIGWGSMGAI
mgnify:CR=1 FL=1